MSVLGRLLIASAERVDLPDLLSIDSFVAGDFKFLLKGLVGDGKPLILKGFDVINPQDAIGSQSVSIRVADSVVLYPGSTAGPFFHGLPEGNPNALPVVPELRKNATNYVYLTFSTFGTSKDTRAFWDPDLDGGVGGEFTQDIDTESVLKIEVNVSTSSFPDNTIPICKVVVGPAVIESIEDARDMMFRLGSGGLAPDPFNRFNFPSDPSTLYKRSEPPTTMTSALNPNPFQGADKNIHNLKEWMDVVMTKLAELGGTTFWYEDASTFSLTNLFLDSLGTTYTSKGKWSHSSATAGQLTWTEDIQVKTIPDNRDLIIRSGSKTLANEEIMYIEMVRDAQLNTGDIAVSWFNGVNIVNGTIGTFQNLVKGDWVKKKGDPNNYYVRVEEFYANTNLTGGVTTAALARSIKLSSVYAGLTETKQGSRSKGIYTSAEVLVANRFDGTLEALGGNLHWLAIRSDTIMNMSNITTSTITGDISEGDGVTAKFVSGAAHGLVDGDYITIAGSANYDDTYKVEVESANIFYIRTTVTIDETGVNAYIAVATTTTRSTADGLLLESANHNFEDDETIIIAGTSLAYDGTHLVKARSATTFSFAVGSAVIAASTGTATLARISVRSDLGLNELVQGSSIGIGSPDSANILSYVGMGSLSQTHPTYNTPLSYNTLHGFADYNGLVDDNLTVRTAKLTAMMADKAQDKTIKLLPSGYNSVTNTTSGLNQLIAFQASTTPPQKLDVVLPGSANNGTVGLTNTLTLAANQAAYITINRNAAFSYANLTSLVVADITDVPIQENTMILAVRLSGTDVWLWDGFYVPAGVPVFVPVATTQIVQQNNMAKLVRGGTWSWNLGTTTLAWNAAAYIQIPNITEVRNTILTGSISLPIDGDVAYVDVNRTTGGATNLTVSVAQISALTLSANRFIIARRIGSDVIVGNHSMLLVDGESKKLYAGISNQNLTFIGAASAGDSLPQYTSNNYVVDNNPLTTAISTLDANLGILAAKSGVKVIGGGTVSASIVAGSPVLFASPNWTPGGPGPISLTNATHRSARQINAGAFATFFLAQVELQVRKVGAPTGSVIFKLYSDSGGLPNTLLATSTPVAISSITGSYTSIFHTFTIPYQVLTANTYHYSVEYDVGAVVDGSNYVQWNSETLAPPGGFEALYNGAVWAEDGSENLVSMRWYTPGVGSGISLAFDASMYLEVKGLSYVDNTILIAQSPVLFANDKDVAYVIPNSAPAGPNLAVVVGVLSAVPAGAVIIARRDGTEIVVGSSSTRLRDGESKKLYDGVSKQILSAIAASNNADNSGQLRLLQNTISPKRVNVSAVNKIVPDGTEYGIQLKNLMMDFSGAQIDFSTGSIYKEDGVTSLGINFTPATIAASQYRWYSVTLLPSTVTGNNKITGQLIVVPASADGASAAAAPKAAFASTGIKLGQVVVQQSGLDIASIVQSSIVQLGTGGGSGSGTGDASTILETIKNHFIDATFDLVTPNIFASNEDDLVDVSSTGSYNIADNVFEMDAAETLVSKQMLDSEFLSSTNALAQTELMTFWNSLAIDTGATYQVSRNGGNEWQTVTMTRVGSTELYRGIHTFAVEATQQTLYTQLTSNANRDLNITTQQEVSQPFVVASGTKLLLRQAIVALTKTGSPTGNLYVSICSDLTGNPNSVLVESNAIPISGLVTGNNTLTIPDVYLAAGTYHIKFRTDATYKGIFAGGTKIALQANSAGSVPYARKYDGSVWTVSATDNLVYIIKGISLDLRVKIISSAAARKLDGYGILYDKSVGNISTGIVNREVFHFSGSSNQNEFTITKFVPNADLLKAYDITSGQVYAFGAWSLQGQKVVFEVGQFNSPGNALTLVFDQTTGGAFDNSDLNGLLLANNHLGSTDAGIDKSVNGRGVFLRRPDGTLREIAIDNSDNIVVYSV